MLLVGDRAGVVQIEEHRRRLGRGLEEILEAAPDVRTDRVALERDDGEAVLALVGVDVEVVHPEVDHDLVELPLGLGRAQDPRGGQLVEDPAGPLVGRDQVAHLGDLGLRGLGIVGLRVGRALGLDLLPGLAQRLLEALDQLRVGHRKRRIGGEARLEPAVGNPLGVELLLDVGRSAHLGDAVGVARARAEGKTVQDVERLLARSQRVRARAGEGGEDDAADGERRQRGYGEGEAGTGHRESHEHLEGLDERAGPGITPESEDAGRD